MTGAREYQAIVVGAGFAGLAAARELRGEVLLLDRYEVGTHQTSACGTPLWVAEDLGVKQSVIQVHPRAVLHTPTHTVTYDASDSPFCTFDYRRFCRGLLEQCRVRFLRTAVRGFREGGVETDEGRFEAPCVIDASGWQRALVGGAAPRSGGAVPLNFGIETEVPYTGESLYFWVDPAILAEGAAWISSAALLRRAHGDGRIGHGRRHEHGPRPGGRGDGGRPGPQPGHGGLDHPHGLHAGRRASLA